MLCDQKKGTDPELSLIESDERVMPIEINGNKMNKTHKKRKSCQYQPAGRTDKGFAFFLGGNLFHFVKMFPPAKNERAFFFSS